TKKIGLEDEFMVPNLNESVSAGKDGKLHITLTNLSVSEDYEIETEFKEGEALSVRGEIVTNEMHAHNTFDAPEVVKTESFMGASVKNGKVSFTIPKCSVLHLEVEYK
ncbi:MAG: alpha-N-arabinofuranosidase, partial [Lachnospiraceae bacterium]|nr:alpha-N-arabinofuranosidase [Lachnospiraceae bacterium]